MFHIINKIGKWFLMFTKRTICYKFISSIKLEKRIFRTYVEAGKPDNVVPQDGKTLTGRLFLYLNSGVTKSEQTELKSKPINSSIIANDFKCFKKNVTTVSNKSLPSLIKLLGDKKTTKDTKFYKLLHIIDQECCFRIQQLNRNELFDILNAYCELIPNRILNSNFYYKAIEKLMQNKEELDLNSLIKAIFYIGLLKKTQESSRFLSSLFSLVKYEDLKYLKVEDLCIISNSAFKTSTKIKNFHLINEISQCINNDLKILNDPSVFITFIKIIRYHRAQNEDLMQTISYAIFFNKTYKHYRIPAFCHILALYADFLHYDQNLLDYFVKCILEEINKANINKELVKMNDLQRFMWVLSNLNYGISKENLKHIVIPAIMRQMKENESKSINTIVNFFHFFWVLNYRPDELVPSLLKHKTKLSKYLENKSDTLRYNFLLTCMHYEDRELLKELDLRPQNSASFVKKAHIKNRPVLGRVYNSLKTLCAKQDFKFEIEYQIPNCNILGIVGYRKKIYKAVHIEVLDDFTSLKNSECRPSGYMQVKLRILDKMEEALIVIKHSDIESLTEMELNNFLQDELNLVC